MHTLRRCCHGSVLGSYGNTCSGLCCCSGLHRDEALSRGRTRAQWQCEHELKPQGVAVKTRRSSGFYNGELDVPLESFPYSERFEFANMWLCSATAVHITR